MKQRFLQDLHRWFLQKHMAHGSDDIPVRLAFHAECCQHMLGGSGYLGQAAQPHICIIHHKATGATQEVVSPSESSVGIAALGLPSLLSCTSTHCLPLSSSLPSCSLSLCVFAAVPPSFSLCRVPPSMSPCPTVTVLHLRVRFYVLPTHAIRFAGKARCLEEA